MIASHVVKLGKARHLLRLTSRAMMRLEQETGEPIVRILGLDQLVAESGPDRQAHHTPMHTRIRVLAAAMNDGAGAPEDDAADLYDALGVVAASQALGRCIALAFELPLPPEGDAAAASDDPPNDPAEGAPGNAPRAA